MSQGQTINGKTVDDKNVAVRVNSIGQLEVVIISGGGSGGGGGDPLAGYGLNNKAQDATYQYYGYEDATGAWYIRRVAMVSGVVTYTLGASNYAANGWAHYNDGTLTYASYGTTF